MNRVKAVAIVAAVIAALTLTAYTTNKSHGGKKVFVNVTATGVYGFPASGTANLTSPSITSTNMWSPSFVTIARYSGSGNGTFVIYSPCFDGGSDTVMAGQIIPEITDTVDSIECVALDSSAFQVEGSN